MCEVDDLGTFGDNKKPMCDVDDLGIFAEVAILSVVASLIQLDIRGILKEFPTGPDIVVPALGAKTMKMNGIKDLLVHVHFIDSHDVNLTKIAGVPPPCNPDKVVKKSIVVDLVSIEDSLMPPRKQGESSNGYTFPTVKVVEVWPRCCRSNAR